MRATGNAGHRRAECISLAYMAWRIDEQVVKGEIDNRTRGRVTGRIWFVGRDEPVALDLKGNPWRDLAGHVLRFTNPEPQPGELSGLNALQEGQAGDITASRKVKVPDCSMEELLECYAAKRKFPWHWGNSLYLEWFSGANGRVVIESAKFQLELDAEPAWTMTDEDEAAQRSAAAMAMADFMGDLGAALHADDESEDDDQPSTAAEAEADEEDARMQLLLDRVTARLEREGHARDNFERIYEEERARLMRERGETEPELTPEEEAERQQWIDEMNAIAMEAIADLEADKWKDGGDFEEDRHPLVVRCSDLSVSIHQDFDRHGWVPGDAQAEHPLVEIVSGVMIASAKLAGALGMTDEDEWPPDPLIAGNVLVRLKKARGYLRDALRGMDSADEEELATPKWRLQTRPKIARILEDTQTLIAEVRAMLEMEEDDGDSA